jgi:Sigma-70, region 4
VELRDPLLRLLLRLPPRQRAVIVARYWEQLNEVKTAQIVGCSAGTVKSATARGLRRLRELSDTSRDPREAAERESARGAHHMNTDLEGRLRADMERFTRDIRVPAGLPLQAYRHNRKRGRTFRVAVASGPATAVAAGAVAIAGASGAFGSSPATPAAQTTAYVLRHVENALAPASIGNLIHVSRIVFPPGITEQPVAGGLRGGSTSGGASSPWSVAYLLHWDYQGNQKYSAYGPTGQHVFDVGVIGRLLVAHDVLPPRSPGGCAILLQGTRRK